jgi:hypothetical protein
MSRVLLTAAYALLMFAHSALAVPVEASALFADAERAFDAGQFREALTLFKAAREAGSAGPASYYNIGVCQYRLRDYRDAEDTFALIAARFPAWRELAEYNRGLALHAAGLTAKARVAFERASVSADQKIAGLARAQLLKLDAQITVAPSRWQGYLAGGVGYDDNVALVDQTNLVGGQSQSSPLVEALGVVTYTFAAPLHIDASGYSVRYADADEFDQNAVRLALAVDRTFEPWFLSVGPTLGHTTLDGDGFEQLVGADLRLRRALSDDWLFETRVVYDAVEAADERFAYVEGSRRQLRLAAQRSSKARVRLGFDLEHNDRADPGVSPSRQRWSVSYQWR